MGYTAKIQNAQGEILQLNDQESKWTVLDIQGLSPAPSQIVMSEIYGMDGAKVNSTKITTRNIVIMLRLNGDADENRIEIYRHLPQGQTIRFFYQTRTFDAYIDGIVETVECGLFSQSEVMQISIICPDPYFRNVYETIIELQNTAAEFEFPFAINQDNPIVFSETVAHRTTEVINKTANETPFELFIEPKETLDEWTGFTLQNLLTCEQIGQSGWPVELETFEPGDVIYVNTDPEHPTFTVTRNGTVYNLLSNMTPGSSFFQLHPGKNAFGYKTTPASAWYDDEIKMIMKFRSLYRGV